MNIKLIFIFFLIYNFSLKEIKKKKKILEGNEKYNLGKFQDAEKKYISSLKENENDYTGNYNLGNTLYRQKKINFAQKQFNKSIKQSKNKLQKSKSYYNLGNTFLEQKKYNQAAKNFKNALILNPQDEQARYNFSYAIKKKKKKETNMLKNINQNKSENLQKNYKQQELKNKKSKQENKFDSKNRSINKKNNNPNWDQNKNKNKVNLEQEYYNNILDVVYQQEQKIQKKIINQKEKKIFEKNSKNW